MLKGLDHIGIIVDEIAEAKKTFVDLLGMKVAEEVVELPGNCDVQFLQAGSDLVELVQLAPENPTHELLKQRPHSRIHICLEVDDIHKDFQRIKEAGGEMLDEEPWLSPHGYAGFFFAQSDSGVLIEFRQHVEQ